MFKVLEIFNRFKWESRLERGKECNSFLLQVTEVNRASGEFHTIPRHTCIHSNAFCFSISIIVAEGRLSIESTAFYSADSCLIHVWNLIKKIECCFPLFFLSLKMEVNKLHFRKACALSPRVCPALCYI